MIFTGHTDISFPSSDYKVRSVQQDFIVKTLRELQQGNKTQLSEKEQEKFQLYTLTQNFIEQTHLEEAKFKDIKQKKTEEAKRIKQLNSEFSKLSFSPEKFQKSNENLDLESLNKLIITLNETDSKTRNQILQLNQQINTERLTPTEKADKLKVNQQRFEFLKKQLEQLKLDTTHDLNEQKRLLTSSELWFIDTNNQVLTAEKDLSPLQANRLSISHKTVSLESDHNQQKIKIIQALLSQKRKEVSENLIKTTEKSNEQPQETEILRKLSSENLELSQSLLATTSNIEDFTQRLQFTRAKFKTLTSVQQDVEKQSSLLGKSVLFSRTLRESLMSLPPVITQNKLFHLLEQVRLDKFQFDQKTHQLINLENFLYSLDNSDTLTKKEESEAIALITHKKKLLEKLSGDSDKLISAIIDLEVEQKRLNQLRQTLSTWLKQKLFWINSSPAINFAFILNIPQKIISEIKSILWTQDVIAIFKMVTRYWLILLLSLVLTIVLHSRKKKLLQWENATARRIGHIKGDSLWLTPWSLLLAFISVLPLPLWVAVFSSIALMFYPALCTLAYGLLFASAAHLFSSFWLHLLKPGGIAQLHFQWPVTYCETFEKQLKNLSRLLIPMTFLIVLAENQSFELDEDVLGMILMTLGTLVQGFYLWKLLRSVKHVIGSKLLHNILLFILPTMSIAQAFLSVSGYYYTALVLEYQILITLLLIGCFVLLQSVAIRSLHIGEHRLAYKRAIQKYGKNKVDSFEEPVLDLATINQQSLRLLNVTLFVSFMFVFYWVWKNFADFFSFLSAIPLWSFHIGNTIQAIQLGDLSVATVIFITTIILTRNLPGLLEVTLLSRLHIPQSNTYAVLKLLSYAITSLGIIFSLSYLGFSWDKLQWLVAAVGLGVSIGLKEVFANLLSGLIILFEQPVRIGDTISFGTGTDQLIGEVSRIRIRATTMVDWDHKEIIIPNAMLLNEKVINWSLSDSIVRIILPFYVEHNTDCDLVEQLILQACKENEHVVDNPISYASLMQYGDSALLYEVRTYITHVKYRLTVINQINTRMRILFNENNINIAPPKQFLYLKEDQPNQMQLASKPKPRAKTTETEPKKK